MPKFSCFVLLLLITSRILSQETRQNFRYSISKTQQTINVDGDESDPAWSVVNDIPNFMNHWPVDSGQAEALTKVKVTYDDEFLYVLASFNPSAVMMMKGIGTATISPLSSTL